MNRNIPVTAQVQDFIRHLQLTMRQKGLCGEGPILILDFLAHFVAEGNIIGISEVQAYVLLPYFLKRMAEDQFNWVRGLSRAFEGGVYCWREAVQYLLRSYATVNSIQSAILVSKDTRKEPNESETAYSTPLNHAFHRCGNLYTAQKQCTMFVDGLQPTNRTFVTLHRDGRQKITYLELVSFAQADADALRARKVFKTRSRKLLHLEVSFSSLPLARNTPNYDDHHLNLVQSEA